MIHRLKLAIAGAALVAVPGMAQAATGEIDLSSTVNGACGVGTPDLTVLDLHDLTGPDGLLDAAKKGNTVLATATIADAWCNTAHELSMTSYPMSLQSTPPYAQPDYLARRVTFNARLVGWVTGFTSRPHGGGDFASIGPISGAYAAPSPGLRLQISKLETLTAGNAEQANLMLEPGNYRGTVTITLAVAN